MDPTKILPGRKTYLAAAGLAVLAFLRYQAGDQLGAGEALMAALGLLGLRAALPPAPPAPPAPQTPAL